MRCSMIWCSVLASAACKLLAAAALGLDGAAEVPLSLLIVNC